MAFTGVDNGITGLNAAETRTDVIANNLANLQSTGFKRSDVVFEDVLYEVQRQSGLNADADSPLGVSFGKGVRLSQTPLDLRQGPLVPGFDLDVALSGDGFFRVVDNQGNLFFTRQGAFQPKGFGSSGTLNLQLGNRAVAVDPPIVLPGVPGNVSVTPDGFVFQGAVRVGRFQLANFRNPQGLIQQDGTLYSESVNSGPEITGNPGDPLFASTVDRTLEGSNVDFATELVDLLQAALMFNFNSQSITTGNEELLTTLELV